MKYYIQIPKRKSVFMVTEDCCYEEVSYDEKRLGITAKIDQEGDRLNSYDLICRCDLKQVMVEITKEVYDTFKNVVLQIQHSL
jgi:hypothetical protein